MSEDFDLDKVVQLYKASELVTLQMKDVCKNDSAAVCTVRRNNVSKKNSKSANNKSKDNDKSIQWLTRKYLKIINYHFAKMCRRNKNRIDNVDISYSD